MTAAKLHRKLHRLGAILVLLPTAVIFTTGVLLQLKKDWTWVQPATVDGSAEELSIDWDAILEATRAIPEAEVDGWEDVDRIDVRPGRGMLKVRCNNRWEVQLDAATGAVLSSTYRRSDLIESIHDGSWFHDAAKLWIFLPAAFVLCGLWVTGAYLWWLPHGFRRRRKKGLRRESS